MTTLGYLDSFQVGSYFLKKNLHRSYMSLVLFSKKKLLTRTVTHPDLQTRGEPGHPDPEIRGGRSQKNVFSAVRASVWSKNKGALPWIRHCSKNSWNWPQLFRERLSEKSAQSRKVLWVVLSSLFFKEIWKNDTRDHGRMFVSAKGKQKQ